MPPKKDTTDSSPMKKYCVAVSYAINVHTKQRSPGEEFDDVDDQESRNLVANKYLVIVGDAAKKKKVIEEAPSETKVG